MADRAIELSYSQAINQALSQAMEMDASVMVLGQLVDYKPGVFNTTSGLVDKFGHNRVLDFPVAEGAMTSAAIGAAITGMRPVLVHHQLDFMLYSLDAITNWLSLWRFKSDNKSHLPVVIRAIVGKGWGQGPQHSKSLHAWFSHLPGIRVAIPATAFDAKGLLLESIFGEDPAIIIEHRSLFDLTDIVPEEPYRVRYGRACIRISGSDVTLVAVGYMVPMALRAAAKLVREGISVEVIDPRTLAPLDRDTICTSVLKTGRLVVADPGWRSYGAAAEIIASVVEVVGHKLKCAPVRVTLPDSHTPMSMVLEEEYYPREADICAAVAKVFYTGHD